MSSEEFQKLTIKTSSTSTPPASTPAQVPNPAQNLALGSLNAARGRPSQQAMAPPATVDDPAVLARIAMVSISSGFSVSMSLTTRQFAGRNKPATPSSPGFSSAASTTPTAPGTMKRPNAPALKLGGGGVGARRGPMMKLPTSASSATAPDPQQNAFKKYADLVYACESQLSWSDC